MKTSKKRQIVPAEQKTQKQEKDDSSFFYKKPSLGYKEN